jgi:hypothetical protein
MPAIVEFPTIVQDLLAEYSDLFTNAPERHHFAEYLTGLFIAERKTISGINREFADVGWLWNHADKRHLIAHD